MSLIDKQNLRAIRSIPVHAAAILLALALAMTFPSGMEMGLRSIISSRDTLARDLALADLEVRLLPEDLRNLPDFSDIPEVAKVEHRLLIPGTLELNGGSLAALTVFSNEPSPQINRLQIKDGTMWDPQSDEDAVVERSLHTFRHVGVGSVLRVNVGQKQYQHRVVGVAVSPEFMVVAANPEYFLPEKGSLAVIFTSLERMRRSLGFALVNDLLFLYRPGADPVAAKQKILARMGSRSIENVIMRTEHISIRHLDVDRDIFAMFQPAITIVLSFLASTLVVINVWRLVRRNQKEIGALLALGWLPSQVVFSYMRTMIVLGLLGCVVGTAGAMAFERAFLWIYGGAHDLAFVEPRLYLDEIVQGWSLVLFLTAASTLLACKRLWRATPLSLMRPAQPGRGWSSRQRREGVGLLWLPLGVRLGIRNTARQMSLTATTVATAGLAVAVAIAYLVCLESMGAAIQRSFADQKWARAIGFLYPTLEEESQRLRELRDVSAIEPFIKAQGQLGKSGATFDTVVMGIQSDSLRSVPLSAGRMPSQANEAVISEDLARRTASNVGESLMLCLRNKEHPIRVVGIKTDVLLRETMVSYRWAQQLLELEDQSTGAFLAIRAGADLAEIDRHVRALDFAGRSTHREGLITEFRIVIQDIRRLVLLVAGIALAVAALFVVVNILTTISERGSEFSILRALGYDHRLIRQILMTEGIVQLCLALVVAFFSSHLLADWLNALSSRAWFAQSTVYPVWVFGGVMAGVLVLALASLMFPMRSLSKSDIVEGLRARVIE